MQARSLECAAPDVQLKSGQQAVDNVPSPSGHQKKNKKKFQNLPETR